MNNMDVKTYFKVKREITNCCYKRNCSNDCIFHILNNGMHVDCVTLEQDYPDKAIEIIQQYIDKEDEKMKNIKVVESNYKDTFELEINELMQDGYKIMSTFCGNAYRAILYNKN